MWEAHAMTTSVTPRNQQRTASALDVAVEEGERHWALSRRTVHRYLIVPWVGAALVALSYLHRPFFDFLTAEDALMEWVQFGLMAGTGVAAGLVALRLWRSEWRPPALLWAMLSLGCVLIAGEEVAWTQRVFGLDTPDALEEINHQGEITVHNINGVQDVTNAAFLLVGFVGSVVTLAIRWREHEGRVERTWFLDLILPPAFLVSLFGVVFGYKLARFAVLTEPRRAIVRYGEYAELCLAVALLSFAWLMLRRLRSRATA
jgi:hypothetical protein